MSVNFDKVTFGDDFNFSPMCSYDKLAFCLVKTDPDGSKHYFGHCFFQSFAELIRDLMLFSKSEIAKDSFIFKESDSIDILVLGLLTRDNVWRGLLHEFSFPLKRVFDYSFPDPDPNVIDFLEREGFLMTSQSVELITGIASDSSIEDGN